MLRLIARLGGGGLRWRLLGPLAVIVLIVGATVAMLNWLSQRHEADVLARQYASAGLGAVDDHIAQLRQSIESYAQLLAMNDTLAATVVDGDTVGLSRMLIPLMPQLGMHYLFVYDGEQNSLLQTDSTGSEVTRWLAGVIRTAVTVSWVGMTSDGLSVLAATPLRDQGHPYSIGTLVIGSVIAIDQLAEIKQLTGVDMMTVKGGQLVHTTLEDPDLRRTLGETSFTIDSIDRLNQEVLAAHQLHASATELGPGDMLVALVSTQEVQSASWRSSLIAFGGLGGALVSFLLVSLLLARSVARALQAVVASTKQLAQGNYRQHLAPTQIRELDELATAIKDMGQQLEAQVGQLTHQAFHDSLSGLPNRALFLDRLGQALKRAPRLDQHVAVVFVDLDNFKVVNDSRGHQVGDDLLVAVARRLQRVLRPEDTVARFGGDEFCILLEGLADAQAAKPIVERIVERFRMPFKVGKHSIYSNASVGVVVSESLEDDPERLLRHADVAMYQAKTNGKGRYVVFERKMSEQASKRAEVETDLRWALERNEFRIHYQPIVRLTDSKLVELEALVRWQHPKRGLISPCDFIPMAEETGLILPIGMWVLEETCRQVRQWQVTGVVSPDLLASVNLSIREFQRPSLVDDVALILRKTGLPPSSLKLELTESCLMDDTELTIQHMQRLKGLGLKLAIDDFGTGYSSLAYLRNLPIDDVKIDRSFVSGIAHNPEDEAIVRAIVGLAKTLLLQVTAEGLETDAQVQHLRGLQCDLGQGYFFARPMDGSALGRLLTANPTVIFPSPCAQSGNGSESGCAESTGSQAQAVL